MKRLMGAAIVAIMLAGPLAGLAGADCDLKLVSTSWDCSFNCSAFPGSFSSCVEFGNFGLSSDFDMFVSGFEGNEGCTCVPSGSKASPHFDASSNQFECTEVNFPSSFRGKLVSSNKMSAQYWDSTGLSCLGACTKRSSSCP